MTKIKNCPFCGHEAFYWEDSQYQDRHVIECQNCGANKRSEYGYSGVLAEWNTRYGSDGKEILDILEPRYRPRIVAELPGGGQVVIWDSSDTFSGSIDALLAGEAAEKDVKITTQVISVSEATGE